MLERKTPARALAGMFVVLSTGCGAAEALPLVGTWTDGFGGSHAITAETWTMTNEGVDPSVFHVLTVDPAARWLSAGNDAANPYDAGLFSQFDWAIDGGSTYFCQVVYDAATQDDAEAATPADAGDLEAGCNGFAWSELTPAE
jgi:hypothetical protein